MAKFKGIRYLKEDEYKTLYETGSVTINGITYTYDPDYAYVTPEPQATTKKYGAVMLASDEDIVSGTDNQKAVTPAQLKSAIDEATLIGEATTEQAGIIKLATDEDITAGTDTSKAVTPAQLKTAIEENVPEIDTSNLLSKTEVKKFEFSVSGDIAFTPNEDGTLGDNLPTGNYHYDPVTGIDYGGQGVFLTTSTFMRNILPTFNNLVNRVSIVEDKVDLATSDDIDALFATELITQTGSDLYIEQTGATITQDGTNITIGG